MILDFNSFRLNESSLKKLKKEIRGSLGMSDRKRMRHELRHNIITFKFRKRNGDLRTAHGTLHPDYLPALKGGGPRPEHQMVYFDLDKDAWRSFRSYSFIKITDIKPVNDKKVHSKPIEKEEEEEEIKKTKPIEKEEKVEKEEKIEKKVEKEEPEEKHIEKEEHKPEHKEEHKKVHKETEEPEEEPEDEEVFTKKKSFTHTEHKEKEEHKDEHSDEDKKDKHKEKDEDE